MTRNVNLPLNAPRSIAPGLARGLLYTRGMKYLAKLKGDAEWVEIEAADLDAAFDAAAEMFLNQGREGDLVVMENF